MFFSKTARNVTVLTILAAFLSSSCDTGIGEGNANSPRQLDRPNVINVPFFTPKIETPLIEVSILDRDIYNKSRAGSRINFRLYDDGNTEFDIYFPESSNKIVKRYTEVSKGELGVLRELLASREFASLRSEYIKGGQSCHGIPEVVLKARGKEIKIIWCDYLSAPHSSPDFPQVLSIIFRNIDEIKSGKEGATVDLQ